jgi:UDPglucose--hexose-1-phosphate uridylyltransferase
VIIENPRHNRFLALMSQAEIASVIQTYKNRYCFLQSLKGIEAITIFKNHGPLSGCSLVHPHSQIVATPVVPYQIRRRADISREFFDVNGKCLHCTFIKKELKHQKRIVFETSHFLTFVPYAAPMPFVMLLLPKKHLASFDKISPNEIRDLALHLKVVLGKLYYGLDNPDFNYTIRCFPVKERGLEYFHWHIGIIPRLTQPAGFEIGSGIFINTMLPEKAARQLRNVKIPS